MNATAKTAKTKTRRAKRATFVELEPIVLETEVAPPKVTAVFDPEFEPAPDKWAHLPDGAGQIRAEVIGARLSLLPTSREAAVSLEAFRTGAGRHYDHLRGAWVYHLDQMRRRGVRRLDEISLLAKMNGTTFVLTDESHSRIASYERHLERQLAPIPRVVWRDDEAHGEGEVIDEKSLGRSSGWRRGD